MVPYKVMHFIIEAFFIYKIILGKINFLTFSAFHFPNFDHLVTTFTACWNQYLRQQPKPCWNW